MTITVDTLKFRQAERMTDFPDGGGQMSAVDIISGQSNQIFDDLTDVDFATGDVSLRKVFAAVTSADTDKYLDAGVAIFKGPANPNVSALLFSTGDYYDERAAIKEAAEHYRIRNQDTKLRLIGTHYANQRTLFGYLLLADGGIAFHPNTVLSLAKESGGTVEFEQLVTIVRAQTFGGVYYDYGETPPAPYSVLEVSIDIAEPLQYEFPGSAESNDGGYVPPVIVSSTQVVTANIFCGITALAALAEVGDTLLTVADTKTLIAPVDYQDLGETGASVERQIIGGAISVPRSTDVVNAVDGYSIPYAISPSLPNPPGTYVIIAYRYGGRWIRTGEAGAASYTGAALTFPNRPDAGSQVYVSWYYPNAFVSEAIADTAIASFTASTMPLHPGGFMLNVNKNGTFYDVADNQDGTLTGDYEGTLFSGTVNYATGAITLTLPFTPLGNSYLNQSTDASAWQGTTVDLLVAAPVLASSVTVTATRVSDDATLTATDDGLGALSGDSITGSVDYPTGLVQITFPAAVYRATVQMTYHLGGVIPQSEAVVGINTTRLPQDGRMPIFSENQLALIHHTASLAQASLSPSQVIDCGRVRLYRAVIEDTDGQRLPATEFTVDRPLGTVTMSPTLDLTGFTGPYAVIHTIADLLRINRVDHSAQTLTVNLPVSHDFPADDSLVSSVLFVGTLQARYLNLFNQTTWTGVWSETRIGDEPLAQYNDTLYPIIVSNLGAYKDRILVKFTSSTAFQVIGEELGVIGVGDITQDCSPYNSLTGQPFFTIDYRGWGAGWATGNCLRFNIEGANYPVDVIRTVQPSTPTGDDDAIELILVGNVDAGS